MVRKNIFKPLWSNWIINQCNSLPLTRETRESRESTSHHRLCSRNLFPKNSPADWVVNAGSSSESDCSNFITTKQPRKLHKQKGKNSLKNISGGPRDDPVMTICHPSWLWHTAYIMWTQFLLRIWFLATNYRHWTNIEIALHLSKRRWRQVLFPSPSLLRS